MKIETDFYEISYDEKKDTIYFKGSLREWDPVEYNKIRKFMLDVHDLDIDNLHLNMLDLDFLNSSGISMLCKFIFEIKRQDKVRLNILGNKDFLWQKKSFWNLKKLWDSIELDFE